MTEHRVLHADSAQVMLTLSSGGILDYELDSGLTRGFDHGVTFVYTLSPKYPDMSSQIAYEVKC